MKLKDFQQYFNRYYGRQWIKASLPQQPQVWLMGPYKMSVEKDSRIVTSLPCSIKAHLQYDSWQWPRRVIYFFSDIHADTDAFVESLVASGGIKKTGPRDKDFKLTPEGKKARFILGGDCFDKGPSTLRLLRMIRRLIDKGADVIILAGNHDTRSLVGMVSLMMKRTVATEHLFIRMGLKPLPLFKEIYQQYLDNKKSRKKLPDEKTCRKELFPSADWEKKFMQVAKPLLSESAIKKDIKNTRKKADNFAQWCLEHNLTLPQVYAAAKKWRQLFLHPKGEFYWFFKHLQLAHKEGSFFFVHAGIDDEAARMVRDRGVKGINKLFRKKLNSDPFTLYYGPLGNMIRTKYRVTDRKFTEKGTLMMRNAGINAIVHGHRNLYYGQRIMYREGMVNFECDTSLDINTRMKEGVQGFGASVTIIRPQKLVLGISSDYPYIKVFEPSLTLSLCKGDE